MTTCQGIARESFHIDNIYEKRRGGEIVKFPKTLNIIYPSGSKIVFVPSFIPRFLHTIYVRIYSFLEDLVDTFHVCIKYT